MSTRTVTIATYIKLAVFTTPALNPFGFSAGAGVKLERQLEP
jgi:hypothetical protein